MWKPGYQTYYLFTYRKSLQQAGSPCGNRERGLMIIHVTFYARDLQRKSLLEAVPFWTKLTLSKDQS